MERDHRKTLIRTFEPFLADTWWFGMTARCSDDDFLRLVKKRKEQGFTAAQIVVGIPPEVGIYNENALSAVGGAFTLEGKINREYLKLARERIKIMNEHGLTAIIYGGWGHQIEWMSQKFMKNWWKSVVETFDDLDAIYCLTGESDIGCTPFMAKALLPDKTSSQVYFQKNRYRIGLQIQGKVSRLLLRCGVNVNLEQKIKSYMRKKRRKKWSRILAYLYKITKKPILIHTTPEIEGFEAVENHEYLAANTFQTGHGIESLEEIWRLPQKSKERYPDAPTINLEPFYEGIHNQFFLEEQLRAFWLSVTAGNHSICYGAHGIWNIGDGKFLSHWGSQSFDEAMKRVTPSILGKNFRIIREEKVFDWKSSRINAQNQQLVSITRVSETGQRMTYIPDLSRMKTSIPEGRYVDVYKGEFVDAYKESGQLVVFH